MGYNNYHSFKTQLGSQPGQGPRHELGGSTRVDPNQCKDKICYYHSFKTQLGGQPKQDLGQRLEESTRVDRVKV